MLIKIDYSSVVCRKGRASDVLGRDFRGMAGVIAPERLDAKWKIRITTWIGITRAFIRRYRRGSNCLFKEAANGHATIFPIIKYGRDTYVIKRRVDHI